MICELDILYTVCKLDICSWRRAQARTKVYSPPLGGGAWCIVLPIASIFREHSSMATARLAKTPLLQWLIKAVTQARYPLHVINLPA